jgi:DNA repair protein RecN (Recombination protein N)
VIERLFFKNHLSFEACDLTFSKGLIVFTGPSGAGKSVFMQALLSLFGHTEVMAERVECTLDMPLNLEAFGFDTQESTIFKCLKSKSVRYFINDQSTSKKGMADVSRTFLNYLSLKDASEFESARLLNLLDGVCGASEPLHVGSVEAFEASFAHYKTLKMELETIEEQEKKVEELKEFARFEIAKIEEVSPKIGEDEELLSFKKALSKKEKLENALTKASAIFTAESSVHEALHLMEEESAFFDEAMNALRLLFEKESEKLENLGEMDIEAMLDRIEKIAQLKKRYGSIEEALEHLVRRREELTRYETLSFEKQTLEKELRRHKAILDEQALALCKTRKTYVPHLEQTLNRYLQELYMPKLSLIIEEGILHEKGRDTLHVNLGNVDVKKISSGEYNRLRLAFLATHNAFLLSRGGVLILDEIDANLSGKESMSVASVLKTLSQTYQIFAISHQPQLSSCAHQHFFVSKDALHVSHVTPLDDEARKIELARMISGESIGEEALSFAQSLLESNRS